MEEENNSIENDGNGLDRSTVSNVSKIILYHGMEFDPITFEDYTVESITLYPINSGQVDITVSLL